MEEISEIVADILAFDYLVSSLMSVMVAPVVPLVASVAISILAWIFCGVPVIVEQEQPNGGREYFQMLQGPGTICYIVLSILFVPVLVGGGSGGLGVLEEGQIQVPAGW